MCLRILQNKKTAIKTVFLKYLICNPNYFVCALWNTFSAGATAGVSVFLVGVCAVVVKKEPVSTKENNIFFIIIVLKRLLFLIRQTNVK